MSWEPPTKRLSCAPFPVEMSRSKLPGVRSFPATRAYHRANSSERSRGSDPQMAWTAAAKSLRASSLEMFACTHVSSVWESHSAARAACHGASTGTCATIASNWPIAARTGLRIAGSVGMPTAAG